MGNDDTITIDISGYNDTLFTNDTGSEYIFNTNANYSTTITGATVGGGIDTTYTIAQPNVYDIEEIEQMCEEYPALDKAYENFRTIYRMVEQDWKGKQND
tara:strand:+ start:584 stop:883 length:300 start_codon:yes stop_codon:yes gene_type:complete